MADDASQGGPESQPVAQPVVAAESAPPAAAPHSEATPTGHHLWAHIPFVERLKRRNVGRVAVLYVGVGYLVLEVTDVFAHLLELPSWASRAVVYLVALGFPIALVLAWIYEEPDGTRAFAAPGPVKAIGRNTARRLDRAIIAVLAIALGYFVADKFWISRYTTAAHPLIAVVNSQARPDFRPPPHSLAVLPFVNESNDPNQEYFSDGLSEEILNDLARVPELRVAARTSAFSLKGQQIDIGAIARKLNVGTVLEGSVRRSATTIRVTAQLSDALTGYQIWSHAYERNVGDTIKIQIDLAEDVVSALKLPLLQRGHAELAVGGTANPAALDAYLLGLQKVRNDNDAESVRAAIAQFTRAIELDPHYALAYAWRASAVWTLPIAEGNSADRVRAHFQSARRDAEQAIAFAPDLPEGHAVLGHLWMESEFNFAKAREEYARALALDPNNATTLWLYSLLLSYIGHHEEAISMAAKVSLLDPLNFHSYRRYATALLFGRRYTEALQALDRVQPFLPAGADVEPGRCWIRLLLDKPVEVKELCSQSKYWETRSYLAIAYRRLHEDSAAADTLKGLMEELGDAGAYEYAYIYSQWGESRKALDWLEKAHALDDGGLITLKVDPLLDPLRGEPRFQALLRALNFPD